MTYRYGASPTGQVDVSFAFRSRASGALTNYVGGFYDLSDTASDFSLPVTYGTINAARGAHLLLVTGALTVDDLSIRVDGTSFTDAGTRTPGDSEVIVIPNSTAANSYFETAKKWNGQVTITKVGGTAKTCNRGFCKYWDNRSQDFVLEGVEFTWSSIANDSAPDLVVRHHKATGWTYNGGGAATPPTALARMSTLYSTEKQLFNNTPGAFKLAELSTAVAGSNGEGLIASAVQSTGQPYGIGSLIYTVRNT